MQTNPSKRKKKRLILVALVATFVISMVSAFAAVQRYEVIAYGDKDKYVLRLQKELFARGYMKSEPTGYFGLETQKALIRYQESRGLEADGKAGPRTQQIIYGKHYEPIPSSRVVDNVERKDVASVESLRLGDEGSKVVKIQKRLKELGYYTYNKVTNFYGPITEEAVIAFQKQNKMTADGVVGKRTEKKLFSSDVKKYKKSSGSNNSNKNQKKETTGAKKLKAQSSEGKTKVERVLNLAMSLKGSSYRTGGTGPNSFDCSGFIYYVLRNVGAGTPRTSSEMSNYGAWPQVSRSELKKGDLVFFSSPGNPNGVGHAGIYIGGGSFIHSTSGKAKGVTVSSMGSGYYQDRYRGARRPLS